MYTDKAPFIINLLLAGVIGLAIYLVLLYVESPGLAPVESEPAVKKDDLLVPANNPPNPEPSLPPAPLFIRDDVKKLIQSSPAIQAVFKGYGAIGLTVGGASYTILLNDDGSLREIVEGLQPRLGFTVKTSEDAFRRLNLMVKHGNLLGMVQRLNEMEFDPPSVKKEFINKFHEGQGFTSKVRS